MKKTITLAACVATFTMHCQEIEDMAPRMKRITIQETITHADGQSTKIEEIIRAIMITPAKAQELKALYETEQVASLKNSKPHENVFMIANTAYFITQENEISITRNITVTDEDTQEEDRISTIRNITTPHEVEQESAANN